MSSLGDSSVIDNLDRSSSYKQAYDVASAYKNSGMETLASFQRASQDSLDGAVRFHLDAKQQELMDNIAYKQQKAENRRNTTNNFIGTAFNVAKTVAPFLLACERRLKQDISPIDDRQSWNAIRDIPIYSFAYKQCPDATCYGPMVDEVEPVDPSLVRPSLLGSDEEGVIHGFDVLRYQAMMAVALRQALCRIEALEASLERLTPATPWPVNVAAAPAANTQPWPVEVADAF